MRRSEPLTLDELQSLLLTTEVRTKFNLTHGTHFSDWVEIVMTIHGKHAPWDDFYKSYLQWFKIKDTRLYKALQEDS